MVFHPMKIVEPIKNRSFLPPPSSLKEGEEVRGPNGIRIKHFSI